MAGSAARDIRDMSESSFYHICFRTQIWVGGKTCKCCIDFDQPRLRIQNTMSCSKIIETRFEMYDISAPTYIEFYDFR